MANYTVADIQTLRDRTGAGMMDVKKALDEADGDLDKAVEILRIKGLKGVTKREGRAASEGLVAARGRRRRRGPGRHPHRDQLRDRLRGQEPQVHRARRRGPRGRRRGGCGQRRGGPRRRRGRQAGERTHRRDGWRARREDRACAASPASRRPHVAVYLHKTNRDLPAQVGVLVGSDAKAKDVARDVAMHTAAYSPLYLSRESSPPTSSRTSVASRRRSRRAEGKPEAALPKIVDGRMNGFFKENVPPGAGVRQGPQD